MLEILQQTKQMKLPTLKEHILQLGEINKKQIINLADGILVWADADEESPKAGSIFSQGPSLNMMPTMIGSNNILPTLERHCSKYLNV